jgi:hypothetical protein
MFFCLTTLYTLVYNDIATHRFQFMVSEKWAILRVQLEIPAHTLPFQVFKAPPRLDSGNLNGTFSLWCDILTIPFSTLTENDWENLASVTSRRVKRQYVYSHQQKEGFKCGGKG